MSLYTAASSRQLPAPCQADRDAPDDRPVAPGLEGMGLHALRCSDGLFRVDDDRSGNACLVVDTEAGNICTCPGMRFHPEDGRPLPCRHVRALIRVGWLKADPRDQAEGRRRSGRLTLADLAYREARRYRDRGTAAGDLFAETMMGLADSIRHTGADSPEEYADRIAVMDDGLRERWEASGLAWGRDGDRDGGGDEPR